MKRGKRRGRMFQIQGRACADRDSPIVGLRRGTGRRSLNSRDAQVFAPIRKERRRSWAYMGRLERKPLYKAENLEGLHHREQGNHLPASTGSLSSFWREEKKVSLENSSAWPEPHIGI